MNEINVFDGSGEPGLWKITGSDYTAFKRLEAYLEQAQTHFHVAELRDLWVRCLTCLTSIMNNKTASGKPIEPLPEVMALHLLLTCMKPHAPAPAHPVFDACLDALDGRLTYLGASQNDYLTWTVKCLREALPGTVGRNPSIAVSCRIRR